MTAARSCNTADLPPNLQREWIPNINRLVYEADGDFVVLTYNILNKKFCPEGGYSFCPDDMLTTGWRHPLLMREIDHHNDADIICMQEVSGLYYDDVLLPDMRMRGFKGTYIKRPLPLDDGAPSTDGSATFYREARFELVKELSGHFKEAFQKELERAQFQGGETSSLPGMLDSTRVYIFTLLRCLKTKRLVAIGNIHLTFDYFTRMDLTALEAAFAINELVRFGGGVDVPHILCGDFNQEPHHPGYQLLHDGSLNETMTTYLRSYNRQGNQQVTPLVDIFGDCFTHNSTSLKSAYETVVGHEIPFTNYEDASTYLKIPKKDQRSKVVQALFDGTPTHPEVRKTDPEAFGPEKYVAALDYLWFSSDLLQCDGILKMVDEELILPFHACPNAVFPSDHLPVKARFSFLKA